MNRKIPVVLTAIGVATPLAAAPAQALAATAYKASTTFRYGAVQVTITVAAKKLKTLVISYSPESARSAQLDQYALPILRQEALKASSYRVHGVSGVTFTSQAFAQSLYAAMLKAHV